MTETNRQEEMSLGQFFSWKFRVLGMEYYDGQGLGIIDTKLVLQQTLGLVNDEIRKGVYSILDREKFSEDVRQRTAMEVTYREEKGKVFVELSE
jgi:hypothetical protein